MKKFLLILLMFFTSFKLFAVTSSNPPILIIPAEISSIQINIPSRVIIYLSEEPGIRIQGNPSSKQFINCYMKGNTLYIKSFPGTEDFLKDSSIKIYISTNIGKVEIESSRNYQIRKTKSGNHVKK